MLTNLKVFKIYVKKWILIFSFLQLILFALIIGSLATEKWVKTENDIIFSYTLDYFDDFKIFDGSKFKGGLFMCHKGYEVDYDETRESYTLLQKDICELNDKID